MRFVWEWNMRKEARRSLLTVFQFHWKSCVCTYLCGVGTTESIASPHHIFDALHFLLVAMPILHGSFLRLLQRTLQGLDPFSCGPETFLQFGKLTSQVCIVTHQLSNTRVRVYDCMIFNNVIHAFTLIIYYNQIYRPFFILSKHYRQETSLICFLLLWPEVFFKKIAGLPYDHSFFFFIKPGKKKTVASVIYLVPVRQILWCNLQHWGQEFHNICVVSWINYLQKANYLF